jgi:ABC-type protease/lipase transport system fused ATPase/permease subunit
LTFENIHISALPKKKRCGGKAAPPANPKVILNDVSGTILPGQFLAIIGASGKNDDIRLKIVV